MALLGWIANLDYAAGGDFVPTPATDDKGKDSGHKPFGLDGQPWWDGEWINPNEVYKKPPVPLEEKLEEVKTLANETLPLVTEKKLVKRLRGRVANLAKSVSVLEKRIESAKRAEEVSERYREVAKRIEAVKKEITDLDVSAEKKRRRILQEEDILVMALAQIL